MAGAAGALLLQGGFLFLFLASMPQIAPLVPPGRELIFTLPRLPPPQPLPIVPQTPARAQTRSAPVPTPGLAAPAPLIAPPPTAGLPDLRDFGQALNGCAPERYRNLPPEQQTRCIRPGEGVAIQDAPNLMGSPSLVKDEAHWEAELARKQSPVWLPCFAPINGVPSINFVCVAAMMAKGKLSDPRSWPIYQTKQLAREDFYKIEQAYDQWHRDHPEARQTTDPPDFASPAQPAHGVR